MAHHLSHLESIYSLGTFPSIASLQAKNVTSIPNNTWAYVDTEGEYYFDSSSTALESLPNVVAPTGFSSGRWFKKAITSASNLNLLKHLSGLQYSKYKIYSAIISDQTNSDPGSGKIKWNNTDHTLVTQIYISKYNNDGVDCSDELGGLSGSSIINLSGFGTDGEEEYIITSVVDSGTYFALNVTFEKIIPNLFADGSLINFKIFNNSLNYQTDLSSTLSVYNNSTNSVTALNGSSVNIYDFNNAGAQFNLGQASGNGIQLDVSSKSIYTYNANAASWLSINALEFYNSPRGTYVQLQFVDDGATSPKLNWKSVTGGTNYSLVFPTVGGYLASSASPVQTASRAIISNPSGQLTSSAVTSTELGYLSGVTSSIQTQLNAKQGSIGYTPVNKAGDTMTGALILNADPVNSLGAATKSYVDNLVTGISWKNSCRVATTANITLSGTQTIDGVSVVAGDRILVKNQTSQTANGIYVVSSGSWSRATDVSTSSEIETATVLIEQGSVNKDTQWTCSATNVTIGTTNITFVQISGAGTYSAGTGLLLSSNSFSIDSTYTADSTKTGFLSSFDWLNFNNKQNALGFTAANDSLVVHLSGTENITGSKTFSADTVFSSTGYTKLASGTTAQQPGTPSAGMVRYNSTTGRFEFYGASWKNHVRLDGDTMTGDLMWSVNANIGTSGSNAFSIKTNNVTALTIDNSQNFIVGTGNTVGQWNQYYAKSTSANYTLTSGTTTSNSNTITYGPNTNVKRGDIISGTNIPVNAIVTDIISSTSCNISESATATGTGITFTITPISFAKFISASYSGLASGGTGTAAYFYCNYDVTSGNNSAVVIEATKGKALTLISDRSYMLQFQQKDILTSNTRQWNIGIGNSTDGASISQNSLTFGISTSTYVFQMNQNGNFGINSSNPMIWAINQSSLTLTNGIGGSSTNYDAIKIGANVNTGASLTASSGNISLLNIGNANGTTFAPSAGNAIINYIYLNPTINQTSTATGTVRGIYYNPTITSVLGSHYALEATSGKVLISDTTSSTSASTGAVVVAGGIGVGGNSCLGGTLSFVRNDPNNYIEYSPQGGTGARTYWAGATRSGSGIASAGYYFIWDQTASAVRMVVSDTGLIGIGHNAPAALLDLSGSVSSSSWSTDGIQLRLRANTYTDTGAAGLRTNAVAVGIASPTFASSNVVTITDAATLFVNTPVAGTNTTITNTYAIWAAGSAKIDGDLFLNSSTNSRFLYINSISGFQSKLEYRKGNNSRWTIEANNTVEAGSDAGSDFVLSAFNDAGAYIDSPLFIARASGGRITFNRSVAIGGSTPSHKLHVSNAILNVANPGDAYVANLENNSTGSGYKNVLKLIINNSNTFSDSEYSAFYFGGSKIGKIRLVSGGTSVAYDTTSDERLKENIVNTNKGLNDLLSIKVRDFNFKNDKVKYTGFVAQEIAALFPEIVSQGGVNPLTDPWMMDYSKLTPLVIKAIQDLYDQLTKKGLINNDNPNNKNNSN